MHFYELTPRTAERGDDDEMRSSRASSAFCAGQTAGSGFSASGSLKLKMLNSKAERVNKVVDVGRCFRLGGLKQNYNSKLTEK